MAKTAVWQLPYPTLADPADITGVDAVDDLAARLEIVLSQIRASGSIPGEIKTWPGGVLPPRATYGHWVWADGASYLTATYPLAAGSIDAAWRTFAGAADPGAPNFRVPDLRGVSPAGLDAMPGGVRANRTTRAVSIVIAGRTGEEYHTITVPEMPGHGHPVIDPGHFHTVVAVPATSASSAGGIGPIPQPAAAIPTDVKGTGISLGNTGGGGAHENVPPTVYVPFIVKLDD